MNGLKVWLRRLRVVYPESSTTSPAVVTSESTLTVESVVRSLRKQVPFSLLNEREHQHLFSSSSVFKCAVGQRIIRPDVLPDRIFVVLRGKVRFLAQNSTSSRTLDLRGPGQLIGWVSLLRASPCEWITASEETLLLAISSQFFVDLVNQNINFGNYFGALSSLHEVETIIQSISSLRLSTVKDGVSDWRRSLRRLAHSQSPDIPFNPSQNHQDIDWFLSTANVPDLPVGSRIRSGDILPVRPGLSIQYRFVGLRRNRDLAPVESSSKSSNSDIELNFSESGGQTLTRLGILEEDSLALDQQFPLIKGRGRFAEAMAVCEMAAIIQQVPFRKTRFRKFLKINLDEIKICLLS